MKLIDSSPVQILKGNISVNDMIFIIPIFCVRVYIETTFHNTDNNDYDKDDDNGNNNNNNNDSNSCR